MSKNDDQEHLNQYIESIIDKRFLNDVQTHREFLEKMFKSVLWVLSMFIVIGLAVGSWLFGNSVDAATAKVLNQADVENRIKTKTSDAIEKHLVALDSAIQKKYRFIETKTGEELAKSEIKIQKLVASMLESSKSEIENSVETTTARELEQQLEKKLTAAITTIMSWQNISSSNEEFNPDCEYKWTMATDSVHYPGTTFFPSTVTAKRIFMDWDGGDRSSIKYGKKSLAWHQGPLVADSRRAANIVEITDLKIAYPFPAKTYKRCIGIQ